MPQEPIADWANPPERAQTISLWDSVHDGELHGIRSDLLARTVTIQFAVPHLRSSDRPSEELTFTFLLRGVQSVRALRYSVWPGGFTVPAGLSYQEQQKLEAEYRHKWREESASWGNFEDAVGNDDSVEITDGDLLRGPDEAATLRLGVQMSDGEWYDVFFRAEGLTILRSDQQQIGLNQFLQLGAAYWEAFADRKRHPQD